jgi:hypothetical protein
LPLSLILSAGFLSEATNQFAFCKFCVKRKNLWEGKEKSMKDQAKRNTYSILSFLSAKIRS